MWYVRTADSVITVFGASVPPGRLLTVWIAGLATQSLPGVQDGPPSLPGVAGLEASLTGPLCQSISRCGRPASPGRMVRKSVPGAIWLALIPYAASSCGVATYTLPLKLCGLYRGVPVWYRLPTPSSVTTDACRLAARLSTRPFRLASWAPLSGMDSPTPGLA